MPCLPLRDSTASIKHQLSAKLDPITRDWFVITSVSVARLALGLVVSVIVARSLGPAAFGVYAVLAGIGAIVGGIADFGLTAAAVRRVAPVWTQSWDRAQEIWRVFFWLRIILVGVVAGVGILLAGPVARDVLNLSGHETLLRLTLIGVGAVAMSGTVTAMLQATDHFGRLSAVMLTNAGLTVVLAVFLALSDHLTLTTAVVVLGITTSLVSFVVGYHLLPGEWMITIPDRSVLNTDGRDLLRFGVWVWVAGLFTLLAAQLDVLLINHWSDAADVGAYALALSLASKAEVVNHSLHAVLLPAASTLRSPGDARDYIRRGLVRSGLISLLLVAVIPIAHPVITTIYGPAYGPSVGLFQGLLAVTILEIFVAPVLMLAFTYDRPRLLAISGMARIGTLVFAAAWLIPFYGPAGAIVARLAGSIAGGVVLVALFHGRSASQQFPVERV